MTTGLRESVLNIINRVERKLGLNASSTLTSTKMTRILLDLLNEAVDEISDSGDWQEFYRETDVSAQSSTGEYEVAVSGLVKRIYEIAWATDTSPLNACDVQDIRLYQRQGSFGSPRHFAIVGVNASSGNPNFRVHPIPVSGSTWVSAENRVFHVAWFQKPALYATTDASQVVVLPANLVVQSVYAKALLHENGGNPSNEFQTAYTEALRMRREALNRFNSDTSTDVRFVPGR